MLDRPFFVITGVLHPEGGRGTKARDRAFVIVNTYIRRLKRLQALQTPYGRLVEGSRRADMIALLERAVVDVATFNASSKVCTIENRLLWERLRGNRLRSIEAWLFMNTREPEIKAFMNLPRPAPALTIVA